MNCDNGVIKCHSFGCKTCFETNRRRKTGICVDDDDDEFRKNPGFSACPLLQPVRGTCETGTKPGDKPSKQNNNPLLGYESGNSEGECGNYNETGDLVDPQSSGLGHETEAEYNAKPKQGTCRKPFSFLIASMRQVLNSMCSIRDVTALALNRIKILANMAQL